MRKNTFKLGTCIYSISDSSYKPSGKGFNYFTLHGIVEPIEQLQPKISVDNQIDKILEEFDFEKVLVVMRALDWKWYEQDGETCRIPNIPKLVTSARRSLVSAHTELVKQSESSSMQVSSGGFYATATREDDGEIILDLKFVVEDMNWSSEDTCY